MPKHNEQFSHIPNHSTKFAFVFITRDIRSGNSNASKNTVRVKIYYILQRNSKVLSSIFQFHADIRINQSFIDIKCSSTNLEESD